MSRLLWITQRPCCELSSGELLFTKEIVHMKTVYSSFLGLSRVTGTFFLDRKAEFLIGERSGG